MDSAVHERGAVRMGSRACGFPGHLRVRKASGAEMPWIAGLFAGSAPVGWVEDALADARARVLVVERFANGVWVPLGCTVTDAVGQTAVALCPDDRRRGFAHEVLRAAVRVLLEEPLTELTACLGPEHEGLAGIFARAGFAPAGTFPFRDRPSTRYVRNLRGDCTTYNVWI